MNNWSSKAIYVYVLVKNKPGKKKTNKHSFKKKIITDLGAAGVESDKGDEQYVRKILPVTVAMTLIIYDSE